MASPEAAQCSWRLLCNSGGRECLLPQRSLAWACSRGGLGSAPAEVASSGLLWQRLLVWAWSCRGHWLRPASTEIPYLGPFLRRLLSWVCSCGGCRLRSSLAEVSVSGPILQRSLAQACPTEVASSGLLSEVTLLYLLLQKSLAQAWSHGGCWLEPAPAQFVHLAKRKF